MQEFWTTVRNMGWNLTHRLGVIDVIDILIVAVIIYELLLFQVCYLIRTCRVYVSTRICITTTLTAIRVE